MHKASSSSESNKNTCKLMILFSENRSWGEVVGAFNRARVFIRINTVGSLPRSGLFPAMITNIYIYIYLKVL